MKLFLSLLALLILSCPGRAAEPELLKQALLTLPAPWLADIPLTKRENLLREIKDDSGRLDYKNDWVHWYSDGSDVGAASQFRLKLLPREGTTPLVFVHMAKPFATGATPAKEHTVILGRNGDKWEDVTESVWPKDVDRALHFAPQRGTKVIEVKAWKGYKVKNGQIAAEGDQAYNYGEAKWELLWDGKGAFQVSKPDPEKKPESGKTAEKK